MGMVGCLAEKRSTTSAVLGPMPGNFIKVFLASSNGNDKIGCRVPWYFSEMVIAACLIVLALFLDKPAVLMACSIWVVWVFARASGVISKLFERFSKAAAVLRSAVF
jgi:hypothetical protein